MQTHDQLGVEIIAGSISCLALIHTVELHHRWYRPAEPDADGPVGEAIPLAARILAVAEAYDSMTSDSVYREPFSREQAIAELRRGAGTQFDPFMVEQFVAWLKQTHQPTDGGAQISGLPTSLESDAAAPAPLDATAVH